ncbi:hypothetical protein HDV00_001413 [Rhizophlyctis rosea]|nr:hypothetical protein HDV00_001413 [Rhizophlyctis rosea]
MSASSKSIPIAERAPAPPPRADPQPASYATSPQSIPTVPREPSLTSSKSVKVPYTSKTITVPTSLASVKSQMDPYLQHVPTNPVALYKTSRTIYAQTKTTLEPVIAPLIAPLFVDDPESRQRNFTRIQQIATLLDAKYKIPFTGITIGIDPLISAVPVVGDVVSTVLSAYVVYLTRRFKVPWHVTARMVLNVALNASVGAIPWLGSLFDVAYKPNLRNLQLLEQHLRTEAVTKFKRDPAEVDAALARAREGLEINDDELTSEGKGKGKSYGSFHTPKEEHLPGGFYPDVREGSASNGAAARAEGPSQKLYPSVH